MAERVVRSSFLLRVRIRGGTERIELQNLKTGETTVFLDWKALADHLKSETGRRGLR